MNLISFLKDASSKPEREIGHKASRLAILMQNLVPVPDGFVIHNSMLQSFIREGNLKKLIAGFVREIIEKGWGSHDLYDRYEGLKKTFLDISFPSSLKGEIRMALERLIGGGEVRPLIVRSSGFDEDSHRHSLAGMYESFPNLSSEKEVIRAIILCWASLFTPQSILLRRELGIDIYSIEDLGMGVIVQIMVRARSSGIIFTASPVTGDRKEIVIESTRGYGMPLMKGVIDPDRFFISKKRRGRMKINRIERRCGDENEKSSIDEEEVLQLSELAIRIEKIFKKPQDIEWVISEKGEFFIVQTRPIPIKARRLKRYDRKRGEILWTSRFSAERWPDGVTPMGWSLVGDILESFIYFPDTYRRFFKSTPAIILFNDLPYFNITIFRHLLFKLPQLGTPHFMLEFFPDKEVREVRGSPPFFPDFSLIFSILREVIKGGLWRRYSFNFLTNHKEWDDFIPIFVQGIYNINESNDSLTSAVSELEKGRRLLERYIRIHLLSLLFANLFFQLLYGLLIKFIGESGKRFITPLTVGALDERTLRMNDDIQSLSHAILSTPELKEKFIEIIGKESNYIGFEEISNALSKTEGGKLFVEKFKRFIQFYGHRAESTWEISSPKWGENPSKLLSILIHQISKGGVDNGKTPKGAEVFLSALKEVNRKMEGSFLEKRLPIRRILLFGILKYCRRYILLREDQRFYLDKLTFKLKKVLIDAEKILMKEKIAKKSGDIFFLTLSELKRIDEGSLSPEEARRTIESRQKERSLFRSKQHPVFLKGEVPVPVEEFHYSKTLEGLPVSPGVASGRIRIVRPPYELKRIEKGNIVVIKGIDPGLSYLFLQIGGFIMETGSLLSHGAVLAREYGIPGVANIDRALDIFKDGQSVIIDGTRGLVFL